MSRAVVLSLLLLLLLPLEARKGPVDVPPNNPPLQARKVHVDVPTSQPIFGVKKLRVEVPSSKPIYASEAKSSVVVATSINPHEKDGKYGRLYTHIPPFYSEFLILPSLAAAVQYPLPFEIPLPVECTVAGTNVRKYNQGQCSRKPCQTSSGECQQAWQCCFEVGQISLVRFACVNSSSLIAGSVIVSCKCQPCTKLQTQIKGTVLSSLDSQPVVLAAIMVGSEIATFTDQRGKFFFELATHNREVTILIQEARHRQLEMTVNVHPILHHQFTITLEYIQTVVSIDKMQYPFDVRLTTNEITETYGINASLNFLSELLVDESTNELYSGPGQVLHSIYHTDTPPSFTMPAIHNMVYTDSKGADFSIQAYVIGSLKVVGENGQPLALRAGNPLPLSLSIKFDKAVTNVANLHLFVYSISQSKWLDHGRLFQLRLKPIADELGTWVEFLGKLREFNPLWVVGFPSRVTCYVKVRAFHIQSHQELVGLPVNLRQNDDRLGRMTFYQHRTETISGSGACLKSVCNYGGIISTHPESEMTIEAVPPSVNNGIIMGGKGQILFYTTDRTQVKVDGKSPYYISKEACLQNLDKRTAYFKFITYSAISPPLKPTILTPVDAEAARSDYCFIKVSVYDCAAFTDVKVLSYSTAHEVVSMKFDIAEPANGAPLVDACDTAGIAQLRASCVEFTCGSDVHVSVQSRLLKAKTKDCRYWSSSSTILWSVPSGHNLTSFYFTDTGKHYSSGLFHSSRRELALMKCYSGDNDEPGNSIDPYTGSAVTFTCHL